MSSTTPPLCCNFGATESNAVLAALSKIASGSPVPINYSRYTVDRLERMQIVGSSFPGIHRFSLPDVGKVTLLNQAGQIFLCLTHVTHGSDRILGAGGRKRAKFAVKITGSNEANRLFVVSTINDPTASPQEWSSILAKVGSEIIYQCKCQGSSHVLPVSGFYADRTKRKIYILTPYCDGGTMGSLSTMASDRWIIQLTYDLLRGLRHLHRKGVCHGDLHGGNIFIKGGRALLADFGEARPASPTNSFEDRCDLFYNIFLPVTDERTSPEIERLKEIVGNILDKKEDDIQLLTTAIDILECEFEGLLD